LDEACRPASAPAPDEAVAPSWRNLRAAVPGTPRNERRRIGEVPPADPASCLVWHGGCTYHGPKSSIEPPRASRVGVCERRVQKEES
jgi:hypothetical protein